MMFSIATANLFMLALLMAGESLRQVLGQGSEAELELVMSKLEDDARAFAAEMERVFAEDVRCSSSALIDCSESHYHECDSIFPDTQCVSAPEMVRLECTGSSAGGCTGRYGYSSTSIRLAPQVAKDSDGNPFDLDVKESFCYSKQAEPYMKAKYDEDREYWKKYDVTPPPTYFGSVGGMFRMYPAKPTEDALCDNFDNTRRPWFVAATSGPKDVILILDISGSMTQRGRLDLMREAAYRVIDTLTVGDHVGVVVFNGVAETLGDIMLQATGDNRRLLKDAIGNIKAKGGTNFLAGFNSAFDLLEVSKAQEASSGCSAAFLFLSDGEMTDPKDVTATQVVNSIMQRQREVNVSPQIFLYGLGSAAAFGRAADDPKAIACATGGMWSHVEDGGDLASSMANYYKRFALGLGDGANEEFVAWVEPYLYSDGYTMGTTVSAPVFDRSVNPSVLVGVVGLDIPIFVMDKALGVAAGSRETLKKLVVRSTAVCPNVNITNCILQSLRLEAGTQEALCQGECTSFVGIKPESCPNQPDLPSQFWANTDNRQKNFIDRACCAVGEVSENGIVVEKQRESQQCILEAQSLSSPQSNSPKSRSLGTGAIIGIVFAPVVLALVCFLVHKKTSKMDAGNDRIANADDKFKHPSENPTSEVADHNAKAEVEHSLTSLAGERIEFLPVPSAPSVQISCK